MGVITPRLSPSPSVLSAQISEQRKGGSEYQAARFPFPCAKFGGKNDIRTCTQFDLTDVTYHRLSQCEHPNTESPIGPLLISSCTSKSGRANDHGDQGSPRNESVGISAVLLRPIVADDAPKASTCMVRRFTSFRLVSLTRDNQRNHRARYPRFEV